MIDFITQEVTFKATFIAITFELLVIAQLAL